MLIKHTVDFLSLIFLLGVLRRVPLTQLLFQIVVLLGEAFHSGDESLNLSLEGRCAWFISLNIVGGRHQTSKYHAILCSGSVRMANESCSKSPHRRRQLMMPKKSPISGTIPTCSKQYLHNKKRRPYIEHQCSASQIPSECQVRTFSQF